MGLLARILQTENGEGNEIVQTVEAHYGENKFCDQFSPSGDDAPPLPEDRVVLVEIEGSGNCVSVGSLTTSVGAKPGEKIIYSRDKNGKVVAKIHLKNDGSMEFSGDKDIDLTVKGAMSVTIEGDSEIVTKGKATIQGENVLVKGKVKIEGDTCELGGTVAPTGNGAFCGLPFCAFSGAPQSGNISTGN